MNSNMAKNHHHSWSCTHLPGSRHSDRFSPWFFTRRFFGTIRFWRTALILCAFVIAGCQSFINPESEGLLLKADFEGYQDGEPIVPTGQDVDPLAGKQIPGLPSGDKIIVCSPTQDPDAPLCFPNCNGSTYSVRSNDSISGQRSLLYQYARLLHCDESCGICEDLAVIDFVPIPPDGSDIPILFFWNGKLSNTLPDTQMVVTVREKGELFSILRLLIRPDRMEVRLGNNTLHEIVTHDFGREHSIFIRVLPNASYQIQIAGDILVTPPNNIDPCVFPNVVCGDFSTNNFDPTALVLRMEFNGTVPGGQQTTQPEYLIDNVKIIQE